MNDLSRPPPEGEPPIPVSIAGPTPVPVTVVREPSDGDGATERRRTLVSHPGQAGTVSPDKPVVMATVSGKLTAAPTTTEEEDRATVGQRRINLIWETTQSVVAITITICTLYVAARLALQETADTAAFLLLSNVFFLVLGTYFNRTNHVKTGGVGKNDTGR